MSEHAHQALPRLPFFFSQRPAQVRDNQQLVRQSVLPKFTAPHPPSSWLSAKNPIHSLRALACQTILEFQLFSGTSERSFEGHAKQLLAGAIDQLQTMLFVERKDCYFDFGNHFCEQRACFHRAQSLV